MIPPHPASWPLPHHTGRYVFGDHRATISVQGAMASGARGP